MLFDLSMTELMLIGVVALVVIGPKDLPKALRIAGFWVKKARTLSREFQSSVEQMMREAELDEMRKELKKASEIDLEKEFHNTIDPTGSLAESLKPPELPKFSDADLPATPASVPETEALPAAEASSPESAVPASDLETSALPAPEASGPEPVAPASDLETSALPAPEASNLEPAAPAALPHSTDHDIVPPKP
jgi:sec-independent protein translocase protein TatB